MTVMKHLDSGGAVWIDDMTILGEVERCFADALGVACQLQEDPKLLPGGGATQVALARAIRRHAETIPGREQMAMEAWADGLEVIPRALAQNADEEVIKITRVDIHWI